MLADDVSPSRLGRAKADVASLLNRLEGERVGLIAFAGQAVVKCPLTVDYDSFRRALDELDPNSAPRGGTAIGDAIRKSLEVFHAKADRDQAILLITDGDDQQSYPLQAADTAKEQGVTIFAVGLGDSDRGARIPQKQDAQTFVEHNGEQVWSKLDGSLLEQIALKTSGVYVPAGTRAYDLGELYSNYLQGRRGAEGATQQKIRRSEQFQIFLAVALMALLIDLWIVRYPVPYAADSMESVSQPAVHTSRTGRKAPMRALPVLLLSCGTVTGLVGISCDAAEPHTIVREGLRLYSQEHYEKAREKFAEATELLEKQKAAGSDVAAFDEACASHRQGEFEKARDAYLRAGLSQNRTIATSAHFNLGNLSAEQARKLAGEHPESVAVEKRQEILDSLKQAIAAYRHSLELQPDHPQSRRNLELVRHWIKYYSEKWQEQDRQKRRDESNLVQFIEFLIQTETALKKAIQQLPKHARADEFAEIKRAQDELREEIPYLREKIAEELRPKPNPDAPELSAQDSKELEEGITLLQDWADAARNDMAQAAVKIGNRDATGAAKNQQQAIDELEKIWDAVIPFQALLARELAEQTAIARNFSPDMATMRDAGEQTGQMGQDRQQEQVPQNDPLDKSSETQLELTDEKLQTLAELQEKTINKSRLLAPKAQAELNRLPMSSDDLSEGQTPADPEGKKPARIDPEEAKAGYLKAIELAPQAIEQMERAAASMRKKDRIAASAQSEEARRILEEIQNAQPKPPPQEQQNNPEQQTSDDKKQKDDRSGDDQKDQEKNKDEKNQDDKKSEQNQKENGQQKDEPQKAEKQHASQDRIEDALRKVRERQQEKRERDRKMKAQFLGRSPVDKDW